MKGKTKKGLLGTAIVVGSIAGTVMVAVVLRTFLYALIFVVLISGMFSGHPSYEKAEKMFAEDYEELSSIASYFIALEYGRVSIPNDIEAGMMSVDYTGNVKIEDVSVIRAIATLLGHGYQDMDKMGNAVRFQRWSIFECRSGIVYSIDGTVLTADGSDGLDYLTRLESLSEPGWYYYEEDYNEWRVRRN